MSSMVGAGEFRGKAINESTVAGSNGEMKNIKIRPDMVGEQVVVREDASGIKVTRRIDD